MDKEFENAKIIYKDFNDKEYDSSLVLAIENDFQEPTIVWFDFKNYYVIEAYKNNCNYMLKLTFDEAVQIYKKITKIDYSKQEFSQDDELIHFLHEENETLKAELSIVLEMLQRRVND